MITSLVHPLRYRWSGQKIHSLTLLVMHPNNFFYRRKKSQDNSHSIVRHCPWTGSHPLYYCLRSTLQSSSDNMTKILDKRLTWTLRQREKKTTSSHCDQCHRARYGDDHLQKGITQRSVFLTWVARKWTCEVFLINVSYQAAKSGKDNSRAQKYVTSFFESDPFFTDIETMITSTMTTRTNAIEEL